MVCSEIAFDAFGTFKVNPPPGSAHPTTRRIARDDPASDTALVLTISLACQ